LHEVKLVNVAGCAGATAGGTKGDFAQATDFAHSVWALIAVNHIDKVTTFVCFAQKAVVSEFGLDK
jgi:hypothetical protein